MGLYLIVANTNTVTVSHGSLMTTQSPLSAVIMRGLLLASALIAALAVALTQQRALLAGLARLLGAADLDGDGA